MDLRTIDHTFETADRRGCAGAEPLHCDFIDDTIGLLNDDAALELFVCIIVALVAVVTGIRKTHYFLWTCLDVLSQPRGYYDAFADARAGCSAGREWLVPPEGTAQAEVFCAFHFIVELLVGCCCVLIIAGPGVTCKLARHMTAASILRYFRSMPQVVRRAAALGCCAGQPRCVPFLALWGAQALKTHATNSLLHIGLASFCHEDRYFSPFHEGLALCFARHKP